MRLGWTRSDFWGVSCAQAHLSLTQRYPLSNFDAEGCSVPVVVANKLTWWVMLSSCRFTTHWPVRRMFWGVLLLAASPRTQRWPSHHTDDTTEMFSIPSSFSEVTSKTGVPQNKIAGDMMECDMMKFPKELYHQMNVEFETIYTTCFEISTLYWLLGWHIYVRAVLVAVRVVMVEAEKSPIDL